jgi:hypothetical protein
VRLACRLFGHKFPKMQQAGAIAFLRKLGSKCVRCGEPYLRVFGR